MDISTVEQAVQAVTLEVTKSNGAIENIHPPIVFGIIDAVNTQELDNLSAIVAPLKLSHFKALHLQAKEFVTLCLIGTEWQGDKLIVSEDADEIALHECADLAGATKWWIPAKGKAVKPKAFATEFAKCAATFQKMAKVGGTPLAEGTTRAQCQKVARVLELLQSGQVLFDDVIELADAPEVTESQGDQVTEPELSLVSNG